MKKQDKFTLKLFFYIILLYINVKTNYDFEHKYMSTIDLPALKNKDDVYFNNNIWQILIFCDEIWNEKSIHWMVFIYFWFRTYYTYVSHICGRYFIKKFVVVNFLEFSVLMIARLMIGDCGEIYNRKPESQDGLHN